MRPYRQLSPGYLREPHLLDATHHDGRVDDDKNVRTSTWTTLPFGRHAGKTLPQVICVDPAWFLWLAGQTSLYGAIAHDATVLHRRTCAIKIPKRRPEKWLVEYCYDVDQRFVRFDIVRTDSWPYSKYSLRLPVLNMGLIKARFRGEWKNFVRDLRRIYFRGKPMTKERAERFFGDLSNFVDP